MNIIMLSGEKRSGKDTTANFLAAHLTKCGYEVYSIALADAMKEVLVTTFGIDLATLEDMKNTGGGMSFYDSECDEHVGFISMRKILQNFGQGLKASTHNDFIWCELADDKLEYDNPKVVYILTDIRLPLEQEYFSQTYDYSTDKVTTIKLFRPENESTDQHISETSVKDVKADYEIVNSGTLNDLEHEIINILKDLKYTEE